MKKPSAILLVLWLPLCVYSQGNFSFDNIFNAPNAPVTISTELGTFNPADGPAGAYVGSDYTASAYYLNGTVTDPALFDSSNPILFPPADTQFLGTTSAGPNSDGGFFDGGPVTLPTTGIVTVQVRAWYNGGGLYSSYTQALAAGQNVGESNPVSLPLAIGSQNPQPLDGLLPFTVGVVPEPSSFVLIGFGGLALLHFARRRK
jgi:hypothetical protein